MKFYNYSILVYLLSISFFPTFSYAGKQQLKDKNPANVSNDVKDGDTKNSPLTDAKSLALKITKAQPLQQIKNPAVSTSEIKQFVPCSTPGNRLNPILFNSLHHRSSMIPPPVHLNSPSTNSFHLTTSNAQPIIFNNPHPDLPLPSFQELVAPVSSLTHENASFLTHQQHHELSERIKNIKVIEMSYQKSAFNLGEYPTLNGVKIIDHDAVITSPEVGTVAIFLKGILPQEKVTRWTQSFRDIPDWNSQRGYAAGPIDKNRCKAKWFPSKNGESASDQSDPCTIVDDNKVAHSNYLKTSSLGYDRKGEISRETVQSYGFFKREVIPFYEEMSEYYRIITPGWYRKQYEITQNQYQSIGQSVFSVGTFNLGLPNGEIFTDSQTACHIDINHAEDGSQVFAVLGKNIVGGELIFPEYRFALKMDAGDLIVMKGHRDLHGNSPLISGEKLAAILYVNRHHKRRTKSEIASANTSIHVPFPSEFERILQRNKKSQKMEWKDKCPFSGCSKGFTQIGNLKTHVKDFHHYCTQCELQFNNDAALLDHKLRNHWDANRKRKRHVTEYPVGRKIQKTEDTQFSSSTYSNEQSINEHVVIETQISSVKK